LIFKKRRKIVSLTFEFAAVDVVSVADHWDAVLHVPVNDVRVVVRLEHLDLGDVGIPLFAVLDVHQRLFYHCRRKLDLAKYLINI
jgi:hypothetical protein